MGATPAIVLVSVLLYRQSIQYTVAQYRRKYRTLRIQSVDFTRAVRPLLHTVYYSRRDTLYAVASAYLLLFYFVSAVNDLQT